MFYILFVCTYVSYLQLQVHIILQDRFDSSLANPKAPERAQQDREHMGLKCGAVVSIISMHRCAHHWYIYIYNMYMFVCIFVTYICIWYLGCKSQSYPWVSYHVFHEEWQTQPGLGSRLHCGPGTAGTSWLGSLPFGADANIQCRLRHGHHNDDGI